MPKALLVVGDGMADRPVKELSWKTPLEVASTPNLTELAKKGATGLLDVISPGQPPGSDAAHLALLGHNPLENYPGRGVFEAAGAGISLAKGDVAFRGNLVTVDENLKVIDRRAGRIAEGAEEIAESLKAISFESVGGVELVVKHTTEHRLAVVFRGGDLSPRVSDTDPHLEGFGVLECRPLDDSHQSMITAKVVNEFTRKALALLKNHPVNQERLAKGLPPANAVVLRGPATACQMPTLKDKFNISSACVAAVALVKGVCKVLGMDAVDVPGATGGVDSNLNNKADAAVRLLNERDFVFIHVKGTDEASHDADVHGKIKVIEKLDSMIGRVLNRFDSPGELYIAVTADHATPVTARYHTGDPTPLLISGPGVLTDGSALFCERVAMKGGLCRLRGVDLMPTLMNFLGKVKKFGA